MLPKVLLATLLALMTFSHGVQSLSCRCSATKCPVASGCQGGLVKDACGCCDVCAKVIDETCGGPWNIAGRCDEGLKCSKAEVNEFNAKGVCTSQESLSNASGQSACPVNRMIASLPSWFCTPERDTYCTRDCKSCCQHTTSCNPDPFNYIPGRVCQMINN